MNIKTYYQLREHLKHVALATRKIPDPGDFPGIIGIELNAVCNARCIFCPQKRINRQKLMSKALFHSIVDQCVGKNVKMIQPHLYGEPFINPYILDYLRYIRQKLPDTKINVITNGISLEPHVSKAIVSEHLLDSIVFSINAASKETYAKVIGVDAYDRTLEHISTFLNLNKQPYYIQDTIEKIKTSASFILCEENMHELKVFKNIWKGEVDEIMTGSDDGKETGKPFIKNRATKYPCIAPFKEMLILSDGRVIFCCIDAHGSYSLGDLNKESIEDVWNNDTYKMVRRFHLEGKKDSLKLCRRCFVTY